MQKAKVQFDLVFICGNESAKKDNWLEKHYVFEDRWVASQGD